MAGTSKIGLNPQEIHTNIITPIFTVDHPPKRPSIKCDTIEIRIQYTRTHVYI